jgi:hypothetical protein
VSAPAVRLVTVLGYSRRSHEGLHPVCADRLAAAERAATDGDVVLLSGWSRRPAGPPEAELMRAAWRGRAVRLLCDPNARTTVGNAAGVAAHARELGATEVVLVTSGWHAPRARLLVRAALGRGDVRVRTAKAPGRPAARELVREAACVAALPLQALRARRAGSRATV